LLPPVLSVLYGDEALLFDGYQVPREGALVDAEKLRKRLEVRRFHGSHRYEYEELVAFEVGAFERIVVKVYYHPRRFSELVAETVQALVQCKVGEVGISAGLFGFGCHFHIWHIIY